MIKVVNKRFHKPTIYDVYIGRPSVLGNPYTHLKIAWPGLKRVKSRYEAVMKYANWFEINCNNSPIKEKLIEILAAYKRDGILNLVCWCKQDGKNLACHGDVIKKKIEDMTKA